MPCISRQTAQTLFLVKQAQPEFSQQNPPEPAKPKKPGEKKTDWTGLAKKYGPMLGAGAAGGLGGWGLGQAMNLGQGGSTALGLVGGVAAPYLYNRYQKGAFKDIDFWESGWDDWKKALFGDLSKKTPAGQGGGQQ